LAGFSIRYNDNSELAYFLLGHPVVPSGKKGDWLRRLFTTSVSL